MTQPCFVSYLLSLQGILALTFTHLPDLAGLLMRVKADHGQGALAC